MRITTRQSTAVLIALAACGDNIHLNSDAAPQPGIDANVPDAPPLPVALSITVGATPVAGVRVYFQNADSSVVSATTTDATGTASAIMVAGGYVTVIDPFPRVVNVFGYGNELRTWAGVKPGDQLVLHAVPQGFMSVPVTLPTDANEGVRYYTLATRCGTTRISYDSLPTTNLNLTCSDLTDILVVAEDTFTKPIDFFYAANLTFAGGQPLDLSASTYGPATARSYTYGNVPGAMSGLSIDATVVASGSGPLYTTSGAATGTGTMTATLNVPSFETAIELVRTSAPPVSNGIQSWVDWGSHAAPFTTDMGPRMLATFATTPTYDVASRAVTWTESGGGDVADFSYARISAQRLSQSHYWIWWIGAPHATSISLPTLPTDVYDFNIEPAPDDNVASIGVVAIAKVPGGYDAVRALLLNVTNLSSISVPGFVYGIIAGATGSMSYALWET